MPISVLYALCVLVWGTTWFAITAQIAVQSPEVGVAVRFALAALVLAAVCRLRGERLRFAWRIHALLLAQGVSGFCASYVCVYEAERHVVSGIVAVGYAASPLVGLVFARIFLGQRMSRRVAVGGAIGVGGVALIFAHEFARLSLSADVLAGAIYTAVSVVLSTLATIAAVRYHRLGVHGGLPLAWAMGYGAAAAALLALLEGRPWGWAWTPAFLGSLAWLALAGSVVAFGAYFAVVRRVGPAKAGTIGVVTPVVALAVSSLFEGFTWTGQTVAGMALTLIGNTVAMWSPNGERGDALDTLPQPD